MRQVVLLDGVHGGFVRVGHLLGRCRSRVEEYHVVSRLLLHFVLHLGIRVEDGLTLHLEARLRTSVELAGPPVS